MGLELSFTKSGGVKGERCASKSRRVWRLWGGGPALYRTCNQMKVFLSYCKVNAAVEVDPLLPFALSKLSSALPRTLSPPCSFTHQTHVCPLRLYPAHAPQRSKLATHGCPAHTHLRYTSCNFMTHILRRVRTLANSMEGRPSPAQFSTSQ